MFQFAIVDIAGQPTSRGGQGKVREFGLGFGFLIILRKVTFIPMMDMSITVVQIPPF